MILINAKLWTTDYAPSFWTKRVHSQLKKQQHAAGSLSVWSETSVRSWFVGPACAGAHFRQRGVYWARWFSLLIQLTLNRFRQLFLSSQPPAAYSATAVLIYWVPAERGPSKHIHISQHELPIKDLKAGKKTEVL